jgi:hypothetical protein
VPTDQTEPTKRRSPCQNTSGRSLLNLRLASGRHCSVVAIHLSETYAGLLVGWPSEETNAGVIETAKAFAAEIFGEWPTFVVPPRVEVRLMPDSRLMPLPESARTAHVLPPITCIARLHSAERSGDYLESDLVLVWLADELAGDLQAWVEAGVHDVPWERYAEDTSL